MPVSLVNPELRMLLFVQMPAVSGDLASSRTKEYTIAEIGH